MEERGGVAVSCKDVSWRNLLILWWWRSTKPLSEHYGCRRRTTYSKRSCCEKLVACCYATLLFIVGVFLCAGFCVGRDTLQTICTTIHGQTIYRTLIRGRPIGRCGGGWRHNNGDPWGEVPPGVGGRRGRGGRCAGRRLWPRSDGDDHVLRHDGRRSSQRASHRVSRLQPSPACSDVLWCSAPC